MNRLDKVLLFVGCILGLSVGFGLGYNSPTSHIAFSLDEANLVIAIVSALLLAALVYLGALDFLLSPGSAQNGHVALCF